MGLGPGRMAILHRVTGARKHADKAPAAGRGPGREEVSIHLQTFQLLETPLLCSLLHPFCDNCGPRRQSPQPARGPPGQVCVPWTGCRGGLDRTWVGGHGPQHLMWVKTWGPSEGEADKCKATGQMDTW